MDRANVAAPAPLANMGDPVRRTESVAKVTGKLVYAADTVRETPLQAYFLTSAIARGRLVSIDTAPAEALEGVLKVYTHLNAPHRIATPYTQKGGYASDTNMPLTGTDIHHDGQIIAMVIADTYEIARDASHRIVACYAPITPAATMESAGVTIEHPEALTEKEKTVGDFAAAFAAAPVKVDGEYSTPAQHQNAIELYSTTASWSGGELTIHEPSQFVVELANGAAAMTGIDPSMVHVVNPYIGGAFGGKGFMTQRTALIAGAARDLGRPVRNVVPRDQGFTLATYRADTKHHVRLAADRDGHLLAYGHESWEMQSRHDDYPLAGFGVTTAMYGKPAIQTRVNMVKADRQTSGFMRAPVEMPYMYALESAMDELAVALDMDPIKLRRVNDIRQSPVDGAPFTSRSLMRCYDEAAASFGWSKRDPRPGSMRDGDWLIGYGCATATYPTHLAPATARVTLSANGHARVEVAGQDSGQGTYTALGQIAARALRLDPQRVEVVMGDSRLPAGPASSNSLGTASLGSAVKLATDKVRAHFGDTIPDDHHRAAAFARLGVSEFSELGEFVPPRQEARGPGQVAQGAGPVREPGARRRVQGRQAADVRLRRRVRGGADPPVDARDPRAPHDRRVRRGAHRQPAHGAQPVRGRDDLGHGVRSPGSNGGRRQAGPLRQRQPRRVPHRRQRGRSPGRRDHGSRGGPRGQSPWREGDRGTRHRRHRCRHCQCRLPRDGQTRPRLAGRYG